MATITIDGRLIGAEEPPYVIAEMSANHNGSLDRAFELIDKAAAAGADAVKIQTYRANTITIDSQREEFMIREGPWKGRTLFELYDWAHTPWEWHADLFARAREADITIFSSPFDRTAVDLLEKLGAPAYKIASFEAVDLPLIRHVAQTGQPMIISTGLASFDEIAAAIAAARDGGCQDLAILRCVSGYPAPPADYNLRTIIDMRERLGVPVGLSDHTMDNVTAIASVAVGASLIEKHFTLDRTQGGPDDFFSLEPADLSALCRDACTAWRAMGGVNYDIKDSERPNLKFRRSLYAVENIEAGATLTERNVRSIRPSYGLPPKHLPEILGRRAQRRIEKGTPVGWDLLE